MTDDGPRSFMFQIEPFAHQRYKGAIQAMEELHERRRHYGAGGGLLLTGPSGAGKSTMLRAYYSRFPRKHLSDRTRIPVLLVSVPSSPTTRSLAGGILEAMGQKNAHRGTAPEKTFLLRDLFAKCGVEMLLIDEFQHLFYTPTLNGFRDVTDWLKNFLEDTKVGMVACGLPAAEAVVSSNEQLARRFSARIRITPFDFERREDALEFRGMLKALEAYLPLRCETPLHDANMARRFHIASYGLLDYALRVLEEAAVIAARTGEKTIDLSSLEASFRNRVWRDVPERLNPFHQESVLRPLDQPGEVFHLHTRHDYVGSPIARKLGMNLVRGNQ